MHGLPSPDSSTRARAEPQLALALSSLLLRIGAPSLHLFLCPFNFPHIICWVESSYLQVKLPGPPFSLLGFLEAALHAAAARHSRASERSAGPQIEAKALSSLIKRSIVYRQHSSMHVCTGTLDISEESWMTSWHHCPAVLPRRWLRTSGQFLPWPSIQRF